MDSSVRGCRHNGLNVGRVWLVVEVQSNSGTDNCCNGNEDSNADDDLFASLHGLGWEIRNEVFLADNSLSVLFLLDFAHKIV